jgi:hypothetical protein
MPDKQGYTHARTYRNLKYRFSTAAIIRKNTSTLRHKYSLVKIYTDISSNENYSSVAADIQATDTNASVRWGDRNIRKLNTAQVSLMLVLEMPINIKTNKRNVTLFYKQLCDYRCRIRPDKNFWCKHRMHRWNKISRGWH